MIYSMSSKKFGKDVEFFCHAGSGYVFINFNGLPGIMGLNICEGGKMYGPAVWFCGEDEQFKRLCRKWWSRYLKNSNRDNQDYTRLRGVKNAAEK
jgi:hypothetical protein